MIKDIAISEELKDLDNLEQECYEQIEKEEKIEREIEEYKKTIANELLMHKTGRSIVIDNRTFAVGYKIEGKKDKVLKLICIDIMMAKLSNKKQGQVTISLDYVKNMSLASNLEAAIEAWLRHITNTFKAEHEPK